jgi:hypothetical protein
MASLLDVHPGPWLALQRKAEQVERDYGVTLSFDSVAIKRGTDLVAAYRLDCGNETKLVYLSTSLKPKRRSWFSGAA